MNMILTSLILLININLVLNGRCPSADIVEPCMCQYDVSYN